MPPVFEFAPAGDRLTLGEGGDRIVAADRQPRLLATARVGDEQQQGEESDRKRPPTPITPHDSLPDRAKPRIVSSPANALGGMVRALRSGLNGFPMSLCIR